MIKEAIILAGGLGTRLRSVVSDTTKMHGTCIGKTFPALPYIVSCKKMELKISFLV